MNKNLAFCYDWIDSEGGAERLIPQLLTAYPTVSLYTLFSNYDKARWAKKYQIQIHESKLQGLYDTLKSKRALTPFMSWAIENIDLSSYKTVLSITSSFMKGVKVGKNSRHVSYVFGPTRWLWYERENYIPSFVPLGWLRKWDFDAAQKPNKLLTLSSFSAKRIKEIYKRDATIIYPPFDREYFSKLKKKSKKIPLPSDFFLFVGRLEPYKKIDILIKAILKTSKTLVIVGSGSEEKKLKKLIENSSRVIFLGSIPDESLVYVYAKARALLMPQAEEFGYTALESLYCNTPVISYAESGVVDIGKIIDGVTTVPNQSVTSWQEAIADFHISSYNYQESLFETFSKERFISSLNKYL